MSYFSEHVARLKSGANKARSLEQVSLWIEQNTKIKGRPYSFKDHEYQKYLLDLAAPEWNVQKPSQVGVTEASLRGAVALCGMLRSFTVAYTLPTASLASTIMKTRVNPIIEDSNTLSEMVADLDNTEVKQIGNSYLYLKGAAANNAAISVPCDMRIHDEVDFSDPVILSQYESRLSHSPYKFCGMLSTPTLPKKGINAEFLNSRRHFNIVKCSCCGHHFIPSYYEHVRIPGFSGELQSITKGNIFRYAFKDAFVECPKCGGKPSLQPEHREWVVENGSENFVAVGVQISPFDAPNVVTPGGLVLASTKYKKISDFHNFGLGQPHEDKESVLTEEELKACITSNFNLDSGYTHVMGFDQGNTCWVTVGAVHFDGSIRVVHTESVPLVEFRKRYNELRVQYRARLTVGDTMPNAEMVLTLQRQDPNLFGAIYTEKRSMELFSVVDRDEDEGAGKQELRQVNISRNAAFDSLMGAIRKSMISKKPDENDDLWVQHLTDMRRMKDWDARAQEIVYKWVKSADGEDHFHHSLLYCYIASQMMGVSSGSEVRLPMISTFRVNPQE